MLVAGSDWWLVLAVLCVWLGSIWLAKSTPPTATMEPKEAPFSSASMGELVEYSGTPVLIVENRRISAANR
ncbi:MAG: hypothetical protein B7X57_10375, partial [Erythrobacter sp. 34-65-8]